MKASCFKCLKKKKNWERMTVFEYLCGGVAVVW